MGIGLNTIGMGLLKGSPRFIRNHTIRSLNFLRLWKLGISKHPMPQWLTIFITNRCNLKCRHCFYWKELNSEPVELTLEEYENIFKSMKTHFRTIRLSGGEPFLRKDLQQFYLMIDRLGLANKLSIPTNGTCACISTVNEMLSASKGNLELNVSVSLDGLREKHDSLRGVRGSFDKAVDTLRELLEIEKKNSLLSVSVCITITSQNVGDIAELVGFLKNDLNLANYGFNYIRSVKSDVFNIDPTILSVFSLPSEDGESPQRKEERHLPNSDFSVLSLKDTKDACTLLNDLFTNSLGGRLNRLILETVYTIKASQSRVMRCLAGYVDGVIYPNGDVSVCEFTKPFANIRKFNYDFPSLWLSEEAKRMRNKTKTCACTHPCHLSASIAYDSQSLLKLFEAM